MDDFVRQIDRSFFSNFAAEAGGHRSQPGKVGDNVSHTAEAKTCKMPSMNRLA